MHPPTCPHARRQPTGDAQQLRWVAEGTLREHSLVEVDLALISWHPVLRHPSSPAVGGETYHTRLDADVALLPDIGKLHPAKPA